MGPLDVVAERGGALDLRMARGIESSEVVRVSFPTGGGEGRFVWVQRGARGPHMSQRMCVGSARRIEPANTD